MSILSYQKAYNLSKQYYPDFYPNELYYLEGKFFIPKSVWQYPTVEGITPSSDFRIEKVKLFYGFYSSIIDKLRDIIKSPAKLAEYIKSDPDFYIRTSKNIAAYEKIEPLVLKNHWKKAAKVFFFLEKQEAITMKDTIPELNSFRSYPNDVIILNLPKDLESSWKEAARKAYTLAMSYGKVETEIKELLAKKAGWLFE